MTKSKQNLEFLDLLRDARNQAVPVAVATVIASANAEVDVGAKMAVFAGGRVTGTLGLDELDQQVRADSEKLMAAEKSRTLIYALSGGQVDVFIDCIAPPTPLIVVGADPDARPVVELANQLGFRVTVVDHRESYANPERYPDAHQTVVARPEALSSKVTFDARSFILIKTHNYLYDKEILRQALKSPACYVGQLGPSARIDDLLRDLAEDGVNFDRDELARLYAPVGLDIGAESPEQIAVSILAEMIAVRSGRQGGFLRDQDAAIHPRDES